MDMHADGVLFSKGRLLLQPHPQSHREPRIFELETGIDVIGQVVAVAMPLDTRLGGASYRDSERNGVVDF